MLFCACNALKRTWRIQGPGPWLCPISSAIIGLLAFAGVACSAMGLEYFAGQFQPTDFPSVVSPKVWLELELSAAHIMERIRLRTEIEECRRNDKRFRDFSFFKMMRQQSPASPAPVTPNKKGGGGKGNPGNGGRTRNPPGPSSYTSEQKSNDWGPLADSWRPRKHSLDGPSPKLELMNAMRGYYAQFKGTHKMSKCAHCGLNHTYSQICHWHRLPFFRSEHFKQAFVALQRRGFCDYADAADEWNSRPGRNNLHRCTGEGKHPKGFQHLRRGINGGPNINPAKVTFKPAEHKE